MGAAQPRLSIQGATDEILRRQGAAGARYGQLYAPPPNDIAALRQQQAAFAKTRVELDRRNSWLAIPAVAPALAVLGLEGAAMLGGSLRGRAGARRATGLSRNTSSPASTSARRGKSTGSDRPRAAPGVRN